jgi:hypothetical protein
VSDALLRPLSAINSVSAGQRAYERDLELYPTYHDGSCRPPWHMLNDTAKQGWNANPREWRSWKSA